MQQLMMAAKTGKDIITSRNEDQREVSMENGNSRALGSMEIFHDLQIRCANTGIYFHVAVPHCNVSISPKLFFEGLKVLTHFQPLLRSKIVFDIKDKGETEAKFKFEALPENSHPIMKLLDDEDDWTRVISGNEVMETIEQAKCEGPLWRAVLLTPRSNSLQDEHKLEGVRYTIIFLMHHAIVDGASCFDLISNQYLVILNQIVNEKSPDSKFDKPLELLPAMENVLGMTEDEVMQPSSWFIRALSKVLQLKTRLFTSDLEKPLFWNKENANSTEEVLISVVKQIIHHELTSKVISKSKQKAISVHSILLSGLSFALAKTVKQSGKDPPKFIKQNWAANLRPKYLSEEIASMKHLGLYAGGGSTESKMPNDLTDINVDEFWKIANNLSNDVKSLLDNESYKMNLKFIKLMVENASPENDEFCTSLQRSGFKIHFTLSNLGKCAFNENIKDTKSPNYLVNLEESYFGMAGSDKLSFVHPFFITVLTFNGLMFLAFQYSEKWITKDFTEKFVGNFVEVLAQMCQG